MMKQNNFKKFMSKRVRRSGFGLAVILVISVLGLLFLIGLGQYLSSSGSLQRRMAQERDFRSIGKSLQLVGRISTVCSQALAAPAVDSKTTGNIITINVADLASNIKHLDIIVGDKSLCDGECVSIDTLNFGSRADGRFYYEVAASNDTFQSGLLIRSIRLDNLRFIGTVDVNGTARYNHLLGDLEIEAQIVGGSSGGSIQTSVIKRLKILTDPAKSNVVARCGTDSARNLGSELASSDAVVVATAGNEPITR